MMALSGFYLMIAVEAVGMSRCTWGGTIFTTELLLLDISSSFFDRLCMIDRLFVCFFLRLVFLSIIRVSS